MARRERRPRADRRCQAGERDGADRGPGRRHGADGIHRTAHANRTACRHSRARRPWCPARLLPRRPHCPGTSSPVVPATPASPSRRPPPRLFRRAPRCPRLPLLPRPAAAAPRPRLGGTNRRSPWTANSGGAPSTTSSTGRTSTRATPSSRRPTAATTLGSSATRTARPTCRVRRHLNLTAEQAHSPFLCPGDPPYETDYTSGMVSTYQRFDQTGGLFEINAKISGAKTQGLPGPLLLAVPSPR